MVKSMYAAVAGLKTHQSKMDVIGNNIANVNTYGFKASTVTFQDTIYQSASSGSAGNTADGGTGGTNANQVGYGVKLGSITADFSEGGLASSSSALDCAIDSDNGFFLVGSMDTAGVDLSADNAVKNSGLYLTRVGSFKVDGNGYLTDSNGQYVYGYKNDLQGTDTADKWSSSDALDTANLNALQLPTQINGEDVSFSAYSIESDGTIVATTTDNQTVIVGKIALANVQNTNGLEKSTGYYYSVGSNAGTVSAYEANDEIKSNYLELSNVDLATQMTDMITTQRGFQANSKIITVTDTMLEELVNMKR